MELRGTRRELLRWLLGPTAIGSLAACRETLEPRFDGGFHDPPFLAAHRLRDGSRPPPSDRPPVEIPVLILGGGISGLSAAWHLTRAGVHRFRVLDLESAPGGTARGDRSAVTPYPWGAHYLPPPGADQPELVELCKELGFVSGTDAEGQPVYDEATLVAAPQERVFYRGTWYSGLLPLPVATAEDRRQLGRFEAAVDAFAARRVDGRRAFALPVDRSSDHPALAALDGITFQQWCRREGFDAPFVRFLADYACRDDYGSTPASISAWFGLHYFAARQASKDASSAPFLTWPNGNAHLADALTDRIGRGRFVPYTLVTSVRPHGDGRRAMVRTWNLARGRSTEWIAERVIFALPSYLRRHLLFDYPVPAYAPSYAPWLVANVHLAGRPAQAGFDIAWDNVFFETRSVGYVVATHQAGPWHGPTVWTYYLPLVDAAPIEARRRLLALTWSEAADAVVRELARAHPGIERLVRRVDIRRWGHGMVRPEPGIAFGAARRAAARPVGPIHFAHTDLSGAALFEEAFFHGTRAAREVLTSLGAGR